MKKILPLIVILSCFVAGAKSVTDYVNPFIGTTNFGTTNPGAVCPNGMMSVTPFNVMGSDLNVYDKDSRWWSTPYLHENKYFTGFSHVNLSGVGCPDLGSLLTMPTSGPLNVDYRIYGSEYTNEHAEPGYYTNILTNYSIKTEVSATKRTSAERYTFTQGEANIILNLGEGLTNESGAWIRKISDTEIEGMKLVGGFCYHSQAVFPIYFVLKIDKEPKKNGFWKKQRPMTAEAAWDADQGKYKIYSKYEKEMGGDDLGYFFSFDVEEGESIQVQMGVSFVNCEGARNNLKIEQPNFNFDKVRSRANKIWEDDLSRIKITDENEENKEVFYSALYHTLIHPNILNDADGHYPKMESGEIGRLKRGENRYTVFSLWDTYRNLHQLMTLVYPQRQQDMIRSMIGMYKDWGWLPKWELYGRETFTMAGDPAIPVITDSWLKGIKDIDIDAAFAAMQLSANTPGKSNMMRPNIDPYIEKGYVPVGLYNQDFSGDNSVSNALEYYIADYALSLLSEDLGKKDLAELYKKRSLGYKNYYCKDFGTLRPKMMDGTFYSPFNPQQGMDFEHVVGFHEGSAWNYTFFVPHDVYGLAELMGGKKNFVNKLQMVFDTELYDPANEPDIAYPYLFSYFKGEEWRTQKEVSRLLKEYYTTAPDGIPGNDDAGTMSAWAVFSMMGFYPDCPGLPRYTLTSPTFDKVEIKLDPEFHKSSKLIIEKSEGEKGSNYIRSIKSGKKTLKGYHIEHQSLIKDGFLKFEMK